MVLTNRPSSGEGIEQDRVHGLALDGASVEKEIKDEQPACSHCERDRHQCHGASGGLNLWLSHDLEAVGDRLDSGVSAGPHRVRSQKDPEHSKDTQSAQTVLKTAMHLICNGWNLVSVHPQTPNEKHGMCDEKEAEDRREDRHGFLHATKIEQNQNADYGSFEYQLPPCRCQRKNAED